MFKCVYGWHTACKHERQCGWTFLDDDDPTGIRDMVVLIIVGLVGLRVGSGLVTAMILPSCHKIPHEI